MATFPADTLVNALCPGCGSDDYRKLAEEGPLGIVRCQNCRLVFTSPRYAQPQAHYLGERDDIMRKYGAILRDESGHNRDENYDQELLAIAQIAPGGRLLDVGSHCGFFLRRARGMGWDLTGVEPSRAACSLALEYFGLNIVPGTLAEAAFTSQSFDVVTLVDVFEHVEQPKALLSEIHRVLKPNGLVFIKVPNIVYYLVKHRVARAMGIETEIFDAKEHVAHYSSLTLGQMLRRAKFGVERWFVPRPIQDGAVWKKALRSIGHAAARAEFTATGRFGPLAMDLAVLARSTELAA